MSRHTSRHDRRRSARQRHERHGRQDTVRALEQGLHHHVNGRLDLAEQRYRSVLLHDPDQPDALHLLGALEGQRGNIDLALSLVRRALLRNPLAADYHLTLGNLLREAKRPSDAAASYRRALEIDRNHVGAWNNLGNARRDLGQLVEAREAFERAVALDPRHPGARNNLGIVAEQLGDREAAIEHFRAALELDPHHMEAQNNLGNALQAAGEVDAAVESLRRAVALDPDNVVALNNLAVALKDQKRNDEALHWYRRALEVDPDNITALLNLGKLLRELDRTDEALPYWEHAFELAPDDVDVVVWLGVGRRDKGRTEEAIALLERALELAPGNPLANGHLAQAFTLVGRMEEALDAYHRALLVTETEPSLQFSASLALVATGRLGEGWDLIDWGFPAEQRVPRELGVPEWDGSASPEARVLVWREQGVGDEILFASCYHDLITRVGHVVIECEPRLERLLARSFPTATVRAQRRRAGEPVPEGEEEPSDYDAHIPAGSLPRVLRRTPSDFPPYNAYLVPDPDRVVFWESRLRELPGGLRVGISWRSRMQAGLRGRLYTSLEQWGPIFSVPGVTFVNLQYDDCSEELAAAHERFGVTVHGWDDIDLMKDLENVAALTAGLDLVIGPGNAVTAMSGALGVPTWQFDIPDDYSSLGRAGYLWLPAIRRFSRGHDEPWEPTIDALAEALAFVVERRAVLA